MNQKKEYLKIAIVLGAVILCFAVIVFIRSCPELIPEFVMDEMPGIICTTALSFFSFFPIIAICYLLIRVFQSDSFVEWLRLLSIRIASQIQHRNIATIYPLVQQFLYDLLCANNGTLRLPMGQDARCLTPRGTATGFRKNCVFLRFELILSEPLDMNTDTLQQIIQQYIWAELTNHGIVGLNAYFQHPTYGSVPSVYLDWVRYIQEQNILQFSVLFISTPDAAKYAVEAYKQRTAPTKPEREVYDDEL